MANKAEKRGREHRAAGKSRSTLPSNKWFPTDKQKRDLVDEQNAWDAEDRARTNRAKKK